VKRPDEPTVALMDVPTIVTSSPLPAGCTEAPLVPPTTVPAMAALPPTPPDPAAVGVDGERGNLELSLLHAVAETASTIAINAKNLRILILHTVQLTVKRRDRRRHSAAFHVVSV